MVRSIMVVALLALAAPAHAAKAFDVPEQEFFTRVHVVAVAPCRFPAWISNSDTLAARSDSVRWHVDSLIVARLTAAGLRVISGHEVDAAYQQVVDSLGGLFDPATGVMDTVREAVANTRSRAIVHEQHHPDVWLFPIVFQTTAMFESGWAHWDGAKQKIVPESVGRGMFKALTFRTPDSGYQGHLTALSLFMAIEDGATPGQSLYSWSGGIHATARFRDKKFETISEREYFADRMQIEQSVELALKPFDKAAQKHGAH